MMTRALIALVLFSPSLTLAQATNAPAQNSEQPSKCFLGAAVIQVSVKDYNDMRASIVQSSGIADLDMTARGEIIGEMMQYQVSTRDGDHVDQNPRRFRVSYFSPDCSEESWDSHLKPFQKRRRIFQVEELRSQ